MPITFEPARRTSVPNVGRQARRARFASLDCFLPKEVNFVKEHKASPDYLKDQLGAQKVDQEKAILAVTTNFKDAFPQYTPGTFIDARENHSILCLDIDGALWNASEESSLHQTLMEYLQAGGVLAVMSKDDPKLTLDRVISNMPEQVKEEIFNRVIISAANGESMLTYQHGKFQEYRPNHEEVFEENTTQRDVIYLVDHQKAQESQALGNIEKVETTASDAAAIIKGVLDKKALTKAKNTPLFSEQTRFYPKEDLEKAKQARENPQNLSIVSSLRSQSLALAEAEQVVDETLSILEREGVNELVSYSDLVFNPPLTYESSNIKTLMEAKKQLSTQGEPLNFATLMNLSQQLSKQVGDDQSRFSTLDSSVKHLDQRSTKQTMAALDRMDLKNNDIVRILAPGNNDQANPMHIAQQVKTIKNYALEHNLHLNIQILVMGQGGHATTAAFHQFASVDGDHFIGIEEADSLGNTLKNSLAETSDFTLGETLFYDVEQFGSVKNEGKTTVEVKLARGSRHTGMNVAEAKKVIDEDNSANKPKHLFVMAATPSSTRQTLTFAQQLETQRYETMTAVPFERSAEFVQTALSDRQAVAEMFAGLGERARYYLYAFQDNPFIPPSLIDQEDLENLYQVYDKLSGKHQIEESKKVAISDLLKFFSTKFQVLEKAIVWNKDVNQQELATLGSIAQMATRAKRKNAFKSSVTLYKKISGKKDRLSSEQTKTMRIYEKLMGSFKEVKGQEKLPYAVLMGSMASKLQRMYEGQVNR